MLRSKKGRDVMTNIIVAVAVLIILGAAITYIVKEKKKGAVCIGCSNAGNCAAKKKTGSGCGCHQYSE